MRLIATAGCSNVANTTDMSAILRYEGADTTADPTSLAWVAPNQICEDEDPANLSPVIVRNAGPFSFGSGMDITIDQNELFNNGIFSWDINGTSFVIDWADPTLLLVDNHDPSYPSQYNVEELNGTATTVSHPLIILMVVGILCRSIKWFIRSKSSCKSPLIVVLMIDSYAWT
jgi:hypothetical protein